MSTKVFIQCTILKTNEFEKLTTFLADNLPNVRSFAGCVSVIVNFSPDKQEMLIEEEWHDSEAHQKYIQFISDNRVFEKFASFFEGEPKISYFEESSL